MPELAELQGWLQARVTGGLWGEAADAGEVVVASAALGAGERVAIYARSYVARLAECLRAEFPVLRAMVGDQVFNLFAGGYLSAHPPTSYSLYDLGAGFPDWLEETRPRVEGPQAALPLLPPSLARLERAIAESGRAQGPEAGGPGVADPAGLVFLPGARLSVPATMRLLQLPFDFRPALAAARSGEALRPPPLSDTLMAVARSHYAVRAHVLEPWAFAWLATLGEQDGDVQRAIRASGEDAARVMTALTVWLPFAIEAGLVAGPAVSATSGSLIPPKAAHPRGSGDPSRMPSRTQSEGRDVDHGNSAHSSHGSPLPRG